jgi:hypothetical protein
LVIFRLNKKEYVMVEINGILESFEIIKMFENTHNVNLDIEIAEAMSDGITDIVRFYEESNKKDVAYGFVSRLMELECDIYKKYQDFFYTHHISNFSVGTIIGNRVEFYISKIEND